VTTFSQSFTRAREYRLSLFWNKMQCSDSFAELFVRARESKLKNGTEKFAIISQARASRHEGCGR
jgi:hypothetical protein